MQQLPRRNFLRLAAGAAMLPAFSQIAEADSYPSRPVRVIVGYGAGSTPDIIGRLAAEWLSQRLGQAFVVEDRPGAGTNLATEAVAHAAPDGYTLLVITVPTMLSSLLYDNLHFDFGRDIVPVACVGGTPFLMIINPSFPAKTVPEFVAYAKANPGKINMASQGTSTLTHIAGEMFKMMAGVDLLHVPYRGEVEAQADLLSGRADVMFDPIVTSLPNVRAGKLRALAVTTVTRLDILPDVPSVAEFVPGYDVEGQIGIGAPTGTPDDVIAKINQTMNDGLSDATLKKKIADLGNVPRALTPAEYRKFIASNIDKLGGAIKFASIKAG
jgi:tripartite-type tricarboxylate transporter receptor subunit TctC